ncbi:hypothetical protein DTO063F5_2717 [Paecilomyces variotii]|nr:hypothetical protein DTO063F5_2717 [Paecilomyces variotii]
MHLDNNGKLAIVQLIYYSPALIASILVTRKQGFSYAAGWHYLIVLSVLRIVGNILQIVAESQSTPNLELTITAATIAGVGLSPLTLATMGILRRINMRMTPEFVSLRVFRIMYIFPALAIVLLSAGGSEISSLQASSRNTGLALLKAGAVLFLVTAVFLCFVSAAFLARTSRIRCEDRKLMSAVVGSLPFLVVRVLYSVLVEFNYDDQGSVFSPTAGDIWARVFMEALEEWVIVALYLVAGYVSPRVEKS